mmetsp:Transcript_22651/g.70345  ORF Transcript_22651/g.70345 Transcript_22651/m.70345 type:complete len:216 (-) Transcript_22651:445-1092(-)
MQFLGTATPLVKDRRMERRAQDLPHLGNPYAPLSASFRRHSNPEDSPDFAPTNKHVRELRYATIPSGKCDIVHLAVPVVLGLVKRPPVNLPGLELNRAHMTLRLVQQLDRDPDTLGHRAACCLPGKIFSKRTPPPCFLSCRWSLSPFRRGPRPRPPPPINLPLTPRSCPKRRGQRQSHWAAAAFLRCGSGRGRQRAPAHPFRGHRLGRGTQPTKP